MKKYIFFALFLCVLFVGNSYARDTDDKIWRTSHTETNDTNVTIATGPVNVYLEIEDAGDGSTFKLYDGTSTVTYEQKASYRTTYTRTTQRFTFREGLMYTTAGANPAKITIFWDWVPGWIPKGQESKGF